MPAGHPPKFSNPDDLQDKIDLYFKEGVKKRTVLVGPANNRIPLEIPVPTITGLCIYLGFESRQSFYDYESRPEFSYTIKKARLFIENEYEEMLNTGNTTGAIFALKNFGWTDKQEIDQTVKGDWTISMNIDGGNKVRKAMDAGLPEGDH